MKRLFIIFFLLLGAGCTFFKPSNFREGNSLFPATFDPQLISSMRLASAATVNQFYKDAHHRLVWSDSLGTAPLADSMVALVCSAAYYGLIPSDYHRRQVDSLAGLPDTPSKMAALDLYLTDAFLTMRIHLKYGRLKKESDGFVRVSLSGNVDGEGIASLSKALAAKNFRSVLESYEPARTQYHSLKKVLKGFLAQSARDTITERKISHIAMNLERWRWQSNRMAERYVRVNIPAYELAVVENDSVLLSSNVIVGKPETPTVELESVIRSFIIYPYWHVPKSIVKEIFPQIQADTLYLRKHNYDVLDGLGRPVKTFATPWSAYTADDFPYILRQREGSENTMGVIKFLFANSYGIYLHDTNARRLFRKTDRALSHGCIRVQKAVELARYFIKDDYVVSPEDLDQYLQLQHRMEIKLAKPIALYLQYFTCEEKDGEIFFYRDIYGKDRDMLNALDMKPGVELASLPYRSRKEDRTGSILLAQIE